MQGHSSHLQASTVATPLTLNLDEDVSTLGCYLTDFTQAELPSLTQFASA